MSMVTQSIFFYNTVTIYSILTSDNLLKKDRSQGRKDLVSLVLQILTTLGTFYSCLEWVLIFTRK